MGGWIVEQKKEKEKISCFLPVWEDISGGKDQFQRILPFPPYMGGCIKDSMAPIFL